MYAAKETSLSVGGAASHDLRVAQVCAESCEFPGCLGNGGRPPLLSVPHGGCDEESVHRRYVPDRAFDELAYGHAYLLHVALACRHMAQNGWRDATSSIEDAVCRNHCVGVTRGIESASINFSTKPIMLPVCGDWAQGVAAVERCEHMMEVASGIAMNLRPLAHRHE